MHIFFILLRNWTMIAPESLSRVVELLLFVHCRVPGNKISSLISYSSFHCQSQKSRNWPHCPNTFGGKCMCKKNRQYSSGHLEGHAGPYGFHATVTSTVLPPNKMPSSVTYWLICPCAVSITLQRVETEGEIG